MFLIVPFLRLFVLFLNVYETFKTLQPPRVSARTGERTVRALSQRKRDMKGCMAVWLVWCSCTILERIFDSVLGIFVPFYSEFKALIYLFQIVTRARGAEPIYLHVIRPLVKPYVTTLDWTLDMVHTLGDFLLLIVALPYNLFLEWWRPAEVREDVSHLVTGVSEETERRAERILRSRPVSNGSTTGLRTRSSKQALNGSVARNSTAGPSRSNSTVRPKGVPHSSSDTTLLQGRHQVWHPPASASTDDGRPVRQHLGRRVVSDSAASTPPRVDPNEGDATNEVEDWRKYPPFPSAYPPTPKVTNKSLSGSSSSEVPNNLASVNENDAQTEDVDMVPVEVEEWRQYLPLPSAYPPTPKMTARTISAAPSSGRQSVLEAVSEQEAEPLETEPPDPPPDPGSGDGATVSEPARRRETRSRSKPSVSQSLPSRTGRRTRVGGVAPDPRKNLNEPAGQDFGQSLERPRESNDEDSSLRGGSSDEMHDEGKVRSLHEVVRVEDNRVEEMDVKERAEGDDDDDDDGDEDAEDEDEDEFDVTLRTPARLTRGISSRKRRARSPSLEALDKEPLLASLKHQSSARSINRAKTATTVGRLTVPTTTRTNSNYTLSSFRASRTSSAATSFTSLSRTSSLCTDLMVSREPSAAPVMSNAPSLSSKSSGESGASNRSTKETADVGSVAGVKRLRAEVAKVSKNGVSIRGTRRATSRSMSREASGSSDGPLRKAAARRPISSGKITTKVKYEEKDKTRIEDSDTLESSDEGPIKDAGAVVPTKKKRRMGAVVSAAAARLDRAASTLEQVPEEREATGRSPRTRSRV